MRVLICSNTYKITGQQQYCYYVNYFFLIFIYYQLSLSCIFSRNFQTLQMLLRFQQPHLTFIKRHSLFYLYILFYCIIIAQWSQRFIFYLLHIFGLILNLITLQTHAIYILFTSLGSLNIILLQILRLYRL